MASYTAAQLNGAGTPIEALTAGVEVDFIIKRNVDDISGSAYFTVETVRNDIGFYDSTSPTNALGAYGIEAGLESTKNLITSSYISSVVVQPTSNYTSSYTFIPTSNILLSSSMLRATGGISLEIETVAGGFIFTNRAELKIAVDLWESDRAAALTTYGEINTWVVSAVQTMTNLFKNMTTFNSDISNWDMTGTDDTFGMFLGASTFNQPLNSWVMGGVSDIGSMFKGAIAFDQPLNDWDVSGVFDCDEMFSGATAFNQDIKSWNTSNFFSLFEFFLDATSFNQDISNWDVSSVTNAAAMFTGAGTFSTNNYDLLLEGWSTQTLQNAVVFGVGTTQYSAGAAATARGVLTSAPNNWVITDGGQV